MKQDMVRSICFYHASRLLLFEEYDGCVTAWRSSLGFLNLCINGMFVGREMRTRVCSTHMHKLT